MHVYNIIGMHVYNIKANVILSVSLCGACEQLASQMARTHLTGTKSDVHGVVYGHIESCVYDVVYVCMYHVVDTICVIQ